jgi:hypothetical protein
VHAGGCRRDWGDGWLAVHLFDAPRTATETVQALCDMEFAFALLTVIPAEGDATSHSVSGAWIARTALLPREAGDREGGPVSEGQV